MGRAHRAQVLLADKGFCGASDVTATAGPGHWWVLSEGRDAAIHERGALAEGLAERRWMARVLDESKRPRRQPDDRAAGG